MCNPGGACNMADEDHYYCPNCHSANTDNYDEADWNKYHCYDCEIDFFVVNGQYVR